MQYSPPGVVAFCLFFEHLCWLHHESGSWGLLENSHTNTRWRLELGKGDGIHGQGPVDIVCPYRVHWSKSNSLNFITSIRSSIDCWMSPRKLSRIGVIGDDKNACLLRHHTASTWRPDDFGFVFCESRHESQEFNKSKTSTPLDWLSFNRPSTILPWKHSPAPPRGTHDSVSHGWHPGLQW